MSETKKFAFLGAGNMATAIIRALGTDSVCLYDRDKSKYDAFADKPYKTASDAAEAVGYADYIFLSVKPQNFAELLGELRSSGCELSGKTFVSIAAGISTAYIGSVLGEGVAVIRTMPNTPLLYGFGVTAICRNSYVSDTDFETIKGVFAACGSVFELPEDKMNTVIAATSSAPAYVYLFIKAITDAAREQGLDIPDLKNYICDMVAGSAETVKRSSLTTEQLISVVTSKGGTTEQAMKVFAESNFEGIIAEAMAACTKRADQLGS